MHRRNRRPTNSYFYLVPGEAGRSGAGSLRSVAHPALRMAAMDEQALYRLTRQLIEIPSLSGDEAAVMELTAAHLESLGLTVEKQLVAGDRCNVFAYSGTPRVVLTTHLDTVPPVLGWSEDDEWIRGRGACDAKGIAAAMIEAARIALEAGESDFGLLFVVAEEADSIGAKTAAPWLQNRGIRFLVNGEPTDSTFISASKGSMTVVARFEGRAAHSAYPHLGDSAILKLASAVRAVHDTSWGSDPELGETTVNVGVVRGGEKPNIVPAWAEAEMIFRTTVDRSLIAASLEELLGRHGGAVRATFGNEPTRMHVPPGQPSKVVAFNTDVPHLMSLGTPLLFGPGSILDAHTADEKVRKQDLLAAVSTYRQLLGSLGKD